MSKIKPILKWIALTLLRASIVVLGYLLYVTIQTCEIAMLALAWVGQFVGVQVTYLLHSKEALNTDPKFTVEQIDGMAGSIKESETINEVADRLNVSYRQARKIKEASKNPLQINSYAVG